MRSRVIHLGVVPVLSALAIVTSGACMDSTDPEPFPTTSFPSNRPPVLGSPSATTDVNVPVTFDLLATASDPDGDPLTVSYARVELDSSSYHFHTVELHADHRMVTVTPEANFTGTITIDYTVRDPSFHLVDGTALVMVRRPNHVPTANSSELSVIKDVLVPVFLSGNDPDGDLLSFMVVVQPQHGTLSGAAPFLTYTPASGFTGRDSFTFTVSDGKLTSIAATVGLDVAPLNHAPVATPQAVNATEDTRIAVTLAGVDPDEDPLSFQLQTSPAHGTLEGSGANLTYTPAVNYHGSDSFTFVVRDATLISLPATVLIGVAPVNDPPAAFALQRNLNEDTPASLTLAGTDADGDSLSFAIQTQPQHGTLSGTPPTVTYTPAPDYNGPDSFTYTASDGNVTSTPATVTLSIAAVNDVPVAISGTATTEEDTPVVITLQATDVESSALSFTITAAPSDGTLSGTGARRTYTPAPNVNGIRSFTFRASDGQFSSTATVTITITPVNDPPHAVDDFVATDPGVPLTINPIANDTDIEHDALSVASVAAPEHGSVDIVDGKLLYTPDPDFTGIDTFTYTAEDPSGASSTATVHVGVGQFPPGAPTETLLALAITTSDGRNAPAMSSDGRYLAFTTNFGLVPEDTNGVADVYVYDRGTRTVTYASVSSGGGAANGVSRAPKISTDGRYIVFESIATNLIAGDTNNAQDVFRHDRLTGETVRVSVATGGGQASGDSAAPGISDDGNRIVFTSTAFDLVANDANGASDIFVRDMTAGTTTRVSLSTIGGDADLPSGEPALSGDGRFVAFTSPATNLVAGDTNGASDIFVRDLIAGITTRVSVSSTGGQADVDSTGASLSRDGRFISFLSTATNLVTGASGQQVYVRDMQALTTTRPLTSTTMTWARLSADGRYLAGLDGGGVSICDRFAAITVTPAGASTWLFPSFSGNGRYVVVLNAPSAGSLVVTPNPL